MNHYGSVSDVLILCVCEFTPGDRLVNFVFQLALYWKDFLIIKICFTSSLLMALWCSLYHINVSRQGQNIYLKTKAFAARTLTVRSCRHSQGPAQCLPKAGAGALVRRTRELVGLSGGSALPPLCFFLPGNLSSVGAEKALGTGFLGYHCSKQTR